MNAEPCRRCHNTGFEMVGRNIAIPCSTCRPAQFVKWSEGGYEPTFRRGDMPRPGDRNLSRDEINTQVAHLKAVIQRLENPADYPDQEAVAE